MKVNSYARKTEALDAVTDLANAAIAICKDPAVNRLLAQIRDRAETTNMLYGNDPERIERLSF